MAMKNAIQQYALNDILLQICDPKIALRPSFPRIPTRHVSRYVFLRRATYDFFLYVFYAGIVSFWSLQRKYYTHNYKVLLTL